MRILGLTTQTILFLVLSTGIIIFGLRIPKEFLKFNFPFIFLLFFSILIFLINIDTLQNNDLYFIFNKNKDLLTEILLVLFFFLYVRKSKNNYSIVFFIEVYFLLNFIYLLIIAISPNIAIIFHSSVINEYNLLYGRERLLGWEPSYTVPVSILFSLIYYTIGYSKLKKNLIVIFTIYILFVGASKTGYILLFIGLFFISYYKYFYNIKNKKFIIFIFLSIFTFLSYITILEIDKKMGYTNFNSKNKLHQYKIISFVTRTELIQKTIDEIISNPLGFGYGTSIVHLSNTIDQNIMSFKSFEIAMSNKYARSSKSQFLEYILSGGIIILILFYFQYKKIFYNLKFLNIKERGLLTSTLILLLITITIGERIPYILILSFIYISSSKKLPLKGGK